MTGSLWSIFKREVRGYFTSPIAYLVAFAMLFLMGLFFVSDLQRRASLNLPPDGTAPLQFLAFLMLFFGPLLTMRLLAEEHREGTMELLLTLPIPDSAIVLGKFLGAWCFYSLVLLLTIVYQGILFAVGLPDFGAVMSGYVGIWLYGGAVLAVGLLFSSLTENQIVAGFLSMATLFILWLADSVGALFSSVNLDVGVETARLVRTLSLRSHQAQSFMVGIIRLEDVVFYAGLIGVMLFIAIQIVAAQRWRG